MYREQHLNKKSDECKVLWYIWNELAVNKDPLAKPARKAWCKCADELSEIVGQELKINPRYKNFQ